MQFACRWKYQIGRSVSLLSVVLLGACNEGTALSPSSEGVAAAHLSGSATAVVRGFNKDGRIVSAPLTADIDLPLAATTNREPNAAASVHLGTMTSAAIADSTQWRGVPSFGAPTVRSDRDGQRIFAFKLHAERIGVSRADGKSVETFMVRKGGIKTGKPVGIIARRDGRIVQYVEFEFVGNSKKPSAARLVQLNDDLKVVGDIAVDLSQVLYSNRLALSDQDGLRKTFSRILRGVGNLVLPDQLHAQVGPDHPCNGTEQTLVGAVSVYAGLAVAATAATVACAGLWFTCPAAVVAAIAAATAAAFVLYMYAEFNACLQIHPADCGQFQNNPCYPEGGGGGTGGGGGGDPGVPAGGWSGSGSGGISCEYRETSTYDGYGWHTNAWIECHAI